MSCVEPSICDSPCSRGKLQVLGILQLAQQCGQAALPSLGSLWHMNFQSGAICYQPQLPKDFIKNKTHKHFANTRFLVCSQNPYYFVRALASWKGIDISLGVRYTFHLRNRDLRQDIEPHSIRVSVGGCTQSVCSWTRM